VDAGLLRSFNRRAGTLAIFAYTRFGAEPGRSRYRRSRPPDRAPIAERESDCPQRARLFPSARTRAGPSSLWRPTTIGSPRVAERTYEIVRSTIPPRLVVVRFHRRSPDHVRP